MTPAQVLNVFRKAGALLEGHFILSSGRHSDVFLQKALVFQYPKLTAKLARALAKLIKEKVKGRIDAIVSPAVGGIIPGYEVARALNLPAMFVEREDGEFRLRRGFQLGRMHRVLMVEDIVTTGLSSRECLSAIKATDAKIAGAACLIDRSGGKARIGTQLVALARVDFPSWDPDKLPPHLWNIPAIKPGSRGLA
jgi:orotate phosphoribosyltransferase